MKLLQTVAVVAIWTVSALGAADLELLKYVGSDAKEIAGVYVDRTVSSPLGIFALSQLGNNRPEMQEFIAATGFDPRRDLREVLMASPGGPSKKTGIIIARGVFNSVQIGAAAVERGGIKESYNGIDIYRISNARREGASNWFAFPEPSIGLLGNEAMVKAAIDRQKAASSLDPRLAEKMQNAASRHDVWFASVGQPRLGIGKVQLPQDSLDVISGGVTLGQVVQLSAEAVMRTEKDARSVVDLIRFLTGMAQLQQQRNPEFAKVLSLLQNAQTSMEGTTVMFSTSAPEADIENLFRGSRRTARVRQLGNLR